MKRQIISQHTISVDSHSVSITVIRSSRARRVRITSRLGHRFQLVVPSRYPLKNIPVVLEKFTPWIIKRVRERMAYETDKFTPRLEPGGSIHFLGKQLTLRVQHDDDGLFSVQRHDDHLDITVPEDKVNHVPNLTLLWLRHQAEKEIPPRLMKWSLQLKKRVRNLRIKDQKSIWGSCSSRGNLNLNWRLILLPEPVVDYIIIHELCHLSVPGHSPRFWEVVAEYCPEYNTHRKWLRENRWLLEFGRTLLHCHV